MTMLSFLLAAFLQAGVCESYAVTLEQANIPEAQTLPAIHADFDNDGVDDVITPTQFFYFDSLTVLSGSTGQPLLTVSAGANGFNGYSIVSFNSNGSYPSIVFAAYRYDPGVPTGFASAAQKIAINNGGTFTVMDLPVSLVGRDVSCTRGFPGRVNPVCFFASYYDYGVGAGTSKLLEVRPDGSVADLTAIAGLPFPATGVNGLFMIGAAWLDLFGDGTPDLVAVGQHSQILVATTRQGAQMKWSWVGTARDYMRAFYYSDLPVQERPLCVYLATEQGVGASDFLSCYNRTTRAWYDVSLPLTEWSYERPVRFWTDGANTVFAAKNGAVLDLYAIETVVCGTNGR